MTKPYLQNHTRLPAARSYNPLTSTWLSVDPLADKYPNTSPYAYCANNPGRYFDPNGMDIWELDECGKIVSHFEDDKIDQFHILDSKGNCIAESQTYSSGTFNVLKDEAGTTLFMVNGNTTDELKDAFEFFADNMDIEWEGMTTTSNNMYLGTSQNEHSSRVFNSVESLGEKISQHCHNHPSGNPHPSGMEDRTSGDIGFVSRRSNMKSYIYTRNAGYHEYNKDTYPPAVILDGVRIVPE